MTTVSSVAETIAEVIRKQRQLWGGVCWLIALFLCTFGIIYLVFGRHATSLPGAFVSLTSGLPGGMHTYGGVLFAAGLSLVHGLVNALHGRESMRDGYLNHALPIVAAVCGSAAGLFAASWVMSGTKTWGGISVWSFAAGLAVLLWRIPPYPPQRPARVA